MIPQSNPRKTTLRHTSFGSFALFALACALIVTTVIPRTAHADELFAPENGFGIGFVLGTPTGLSGSLPVGENNAINAVLGYKVYGEANLHLQADYVWFIRDIFPVESGTISAYYGPGAFAVASKDASVGVRMALGVDYRFEAAPFQVFFEIGPGIEVLPGTEAAFGGGIGLRYFF